MLSPEWCDVRPCGQVLQRNAESLVEEALREVPPSDLKQVLSLRMEPQLIRSLRRIASERGTTVSELLRAAAADIVNDASVPTRCHLPHGPSACQEGQDVACYRPLQGRPHHAQQQPNKGNGLRGNGLKTHLAGRADREFRLVSGSRRRSVRTQRQAQDDRWGRLRDPARPAQPRHRLFG